MTPSISFLSVVAVTLVTTFSHAQTVRGDAKAAEAKVAMCIGCHGIPGYQSSFPEVYRVPMLGGQVAGFIAAALTAYQTGDRRHPTMRAVAQSLTAQDIADLAAYYTAQAPTGPALAEKPATEPDARVRDLLDKGACASCHGANFSRPVDPSFPKLAGQPADYLYAALKAYKVGKQAMWGRAHPVMGAVVMPFTHAELKEMATYLASLDSELKTVPQSRFR